MGAMAGVGRSAPQGAPEVLDLSQEVPKVLQVSRRSPAVLVEEVSGVSMWEVGFNSPGELFLYDQAQGQLHTV